MLKIGCSQTVLDVPLFVELYGYGIGAVRCNRGTHDPLYCRAFSFNDGRKHGLLIYTDSCSSDDLLCREMRAVLASALNLDPNGIAFVATHTHSGPNIRESGSGSGFGEPDPRVAANWKKCVLKVAEDAVLHEEAIDRVKFARAPLTRPLGANRVNPEKNATDPSIRWMNFLRKDGSSKLLLHNHGIHGISMNGKTFHLVSADWAGAVNRMLLEEKITDMPFFLLGACGDVNTYTGNSDEGPEFTEAAGKIAGQYVDDLKRSLNGPAEEMSAEDFTVSFVLKTVEFPAVKLPEEKLREEIKVWDEVIATRKNPLAADFFRHFTRRLEETIVLLRRGHDLRIFHDLQVIRIGPLTVFTVPGEYFVEEGMKLLNASGSVFPMLAEVSNGNGGYYPDEETMKKYPDVSCRIKAAGSFWGFYEIYGYMHSHRFKYQDHISAFLAERLLTMEKSANE